MEGFLSDDMAKNKNCPFSYASMLIVKRMWSNIYANIHKQIAQLHSILYYGTKSFTHVNHIPLKKIDNYNTPSPHPAVSS